MHGECIVRRFHDADWAGCVEDQKSNLGCCFNIVSGVVSWFSRKHKTVALRLEEAEYMTASMAACEGIWLRKLLASYSSVSERLQ